MLEQFARDFGYLDKFLVNMAKHAETLPGERGARLKQLMAEEAGRWDEVKRILAGGAPSAAPAPSSATPPSPTTETPPGPKAPAGLTVGSLLGQPKK